VKNRSSRIALLIPVYNGIDSIETVLLGCKKLGMPIIVLDDGSTDGTGDRVRQVGVDFIVRHAVNEGKGQALKDGLRLAREKGFEEIGRAHV